MLTRPLSRREVLDSVARRLDCASGVTCLEMKRGLVNLGTIASTAPLIGLFGTVIGILDAFKGCIGEKWFCIMMVIEGVTEALVTAALGLLVAIPAAWFYNYLTDRLEVFSVEMSLASSELLTYLTAYARRSPSHDSHPTRRI